MALAFGVLKGHPHPVPCLRYYSPFRLVRLNVSSLSYLFSVSFHHHPRLFLPVSSVVTPISSFTLQRPLLFLIILYTQCRMIYTYSLFKIYCGVVSVQSFSMTNKYKTVYWNSFLLNWFILFISLIFVAYSSRFFRSGFFLHSNW